MDKGSTGIIALSNIEFREASEKELWRTYLAVVFQSAMKIAWAYTKPLLGPGTGKREDEKDRQRCRGGVGGHETHKRLLYISESK